MEAAPKFMLRDVTVHSRASSVPKPPWKEYHASTHRSTICPELLSLNFFSPNATRGRVFGLL